MDEHQEGCDEDPDFIESDHDFESNAPDSDWFEGNIQPVGTLSERAVDERGKMVSDRGQRASSDQTFHFIPTPMLYHEARSSRLTSGPTASFCTQPIPVDVPTGDVNFDDAVDDVEYASMRPLKGWKRSRLNYRASA